ncbi:hypothetical protein K7X08_007201 [Anisodus acutangulus]|uniref:Uncharacterized protein n=1 Tax=Anisodus acutangulus TaxID=402998 RepID=A0A9Q1LDM7_9SOLA|nr:hypothetical protein K7X08_007201 [Anisodus acutangulus]
MSHTVELEEFIARDRARHTRILRSSNGGVINFQRKLNICRKKNVFQRESHLIEMNFYDTANSSTPFFLG